MPPVLSKAFFQGNEANRYCVSCPPLLWLKKARLGFLIIMPQGTLLVHRWRKAKAMKYTATSCEKTQKKCLLHQHSLGYFVLLLWQNVHSQT